MAFWNRKRSNKHNSLLKTIRFDSAPAPSYREDFFDYDSKLVGTPQRFGDTHPVIRGIAKTGTNYELLNSLYHTSGIAHKVVTKPAEDATRNGWRLVIPDDPVKQAKYQKALNKLNLKKVLSQELIYQRLHGDGYITIGIDEPKFNANTADPLPDPPVLNDVPYVHAFGQNHVKKVETNTDPTSPDYMQESAVVIDQVNTGVKVNKQGEEISQPPQTKPVVIDKSRYFHISLDRLEDDDTGTSVLERCYDQIKTLDTALYSAGKLMYAWDINVVYSDSLQNPDDPESDSMFSEKVKQLKEGMSTDSVLLLDQGEKFERVSNNTSGFDTLLSFAWQNLAAAANIPKSVLTGEQAGTLAGASQDVINYYDGIKSIQEDVLRPQLECIAKLLMWASDVADGSEDPDKFDWHIQFNPLWSADDKTQSETFVNYANAASTLVSAGISDPDEAGKMLQGQNNNQVSGMQTKTDSQDEHIDEEVVRQYSNDKAGIANEKSNLS